MGNEIGKFDMGSVAEKLREKIRAAMLDVVPEEVWDQMIRAEIQAFTQGWSERAYDGPRHHPSGLARVVRAELEEDVRRRVQAYFASPDWDVRWTADDRGGHPEPFGEALRKLVVELAPQIAEALLRTQITQMLYSMRST